MSASDRKKALIKERQRLIQLGYETCLQTEHGRALLWDLLEACGVFRLSFDPQSPHLTSFGEGKRDIGNAVLARIARSHPQGFVALMHENNERLENERRRGRDAPDGPSAGDNDAGGGNAEE